MFSLDHFKILFFLSILFLYNSAQEFCLKEERSNCTSTPTTKDIYSKGKKELQYLQYISNNIISDKPLEYEKYFGLINEAKDKYVPCEHNNCKCYASVITKDLKIFKNGITKEGINNVKSK